MKIIRYSAKDVLRLSAVEVTPQGNVVTIGGKNGAGKSSLLDSIAMTLGGKRAMPEEPVRRGAKRAETIVEIGEAGKVELIVERSITAGGTDTLVVRAPDGAPQKRPQAILDKLIGSIAFDPLAFATMEAKPQEELLRKLVGLDFSDLDAERSRMYEDRRVANAEEKALAARVAAMPFHDDAPEEEISLEALATEMASHQATVRAFDQLGNRRNAAKLALDMTQGKVDKARAVLATAEAELESCALLLTQVEAEVAAAPIPESDIEARAQTADAFNAKVRANRDRHKVLHEREAATEKWAKLELRVKSIDAEKARLLAAAAFPVPGLSIGDNGVTFDGFPFAQVNTAGKLRVSLAIGMAMNPRLRVMFVRDGSLLDEDGLRVIAEMAAAADCQVWMEDARTTDPTAVIIEDGHVKGDGLSESDRDESLDHPPIYDPGHGPVTEAEVLATATEEEGLF